MSRDKEIFKRELEELCKKYNASLSAGSKGIVFNFHNEADINVFDGYYKQKFISKKFIKVDEQITGGLNYVNQKRMDENKANTQRIQQKKKVDIRGMVFIWYYSTIYSQERLLLKCCANNRGNFK